MRADHCGWWVGPVWKLGGETCVCHLPKDHPDGHECDCGSWFDNCGHPPATMSGATNAG